MIVGNTEARSGKEGLGGRQEDGELIRPLSLFTRPVSAFKMICSYILMPLAFLLGASWDDAGLVAEMLGIKFFLNEFVAYQQLSTYKQRRLDGHPEWDGPQKQWISVSAAVTGHLGREQCSL